MHFRRLMLLGSLVFLSAVSIAQDRCTLSLSGQVLDEHDNQPLAYANILIEELGKGGTADPEGNYQIDGLCAGEYTLVCNHIGCEPIRKTVVLKRNTKVDFRPEHHTELLKLLQITAERTRNPSGQSVTRLSQRELERTAGQALGNQLRQVTGVNTLNTGNSIAKPVIHGLHSNRILILNNGIRQEGQQWGNEHAPEIDPFLAEELTVIKGPASVRYGPDAIGGVILVEPRALPDSGGLGGKVNLVGFSNGRQGVASGMLEGQTPIKGLSWRTQGTYKRGGNVQAPNYYLKNSGIEEVNFSGALKYQRDNAGAEVFYSQFNTDIGIFSAAHIGNLTDLQRAFEADEPLEPADFTYDINRPFQHIRHELFKAKAFWDIRPGERITATYARQSNNREEFDKHLPRNDSLAALNLPELDFEITTQTGDLIWEKQSGAWSTTAGFSGLYQENTYNGRFFIPFFRKWGAGAFVIERWQPDSSRWTLEGGLRFDHVFQEVFLRENDQVVSPDYPYNNMSGSLGARYRLEENWQFRMHAGTAWRPPHVSELYSNGLHHGAAAVEFGDTNLVQEQAYSFSAAVSYASDRFRVDVEGYLNYIDNFIYLKPDLPPTLTIRGAFPTFCYSQVDALLRGIDLTASYQVVDPLTASVKASLLRARNLEADEWLVNMPADRFEYALEYRLKNTERFRNTSFTAAVSHVLEQTRVPENSDFADPPAGYALLNLEAASDLQLGPQRITVGLGVQNALNVSYRDYLNRFRYYTDDLGRNVSLRLTVPIGSLN